MADLASKPLFPWESNRKPTLGEKTVAAIWDVDGAKFTFFRDGAVEAIANGTSGSGTGTPSYFVIHWSNGVDASFYSTAQGDNRFYVCWANSAGGYGWFNATQRA